MNEVKIHITPEGECSMLSCFISEQDVKESSRDLYRRTLKLFFEWVANTGRNMDDLTRSDILCYKDHLFEKGLSSLTVASYLTSLRKFFSWCESQKIYPDIMRNVKTPRRELRFRKQHLTESNVNDFLEHFKGSLRNYAIANLLVRGGLRTIELVRADVGDICFLRGKRILKLWGKGHDSKDSYIVLSDKAYRPIVEYLKTRKNVRLNSPLFVSDSIRNQGQRLTTRTISGLCKEALKAIGLDGREYSCHSLRHTTASLLLKHGADLMSVQTVLRHSDPSTTQVYLESIREEIRLEKAPEEILDDVF